MSVPQTVEMLVPGARIRLLQARLESADEDRGAELDVIGMSPNFAENERVMVRSSNGAYRWVFRVARNTVYDYGLGLGFEIVSSPAYRAPAPAPQAKSSGFDAEGWLAQLMSQTGRSRINDETRAKLLALTDKNAMNREFFAYVAATPVEAQVLTDVAITSLDAIITPRTSPEYLNAERQKADFIKQAQQYMRHVDERLEQAVRQEEKMMQIEQRTSIKISDKINEILKAGWYELDVDDLVSQGSSIQRVTFITPPITIAHYNAKAGIEMKVPMGSYKVTWFPRQGQVRAVGHVGHITVEGYQHPHITSEGGICWGNAVDVHSNGMSNFDPKPSLEALQVILQNYNPASPYVRLDAWQVRREADKYIGMPTKFVQHDTRAWIDENDMPESHATTYEHDTREEEDEDGDSRIQYLMTVFKKVYENGHPIPSEEDKYYVKHRNGRYHQVEIYEWE